MCRLCVASRILTVGFFFSHTFHFLLGSPWPHDCCSHEHALRQQEEVCPCQVCSCQEDFV